MRNLDKKTMHTIKLNAQIVDAGALAFASFEFQQEAACVGLHSPQFIEFVVKTIPHDAAVAQAGCWLVFERRLKKLMDIGFQR